MSPMNLSGALRNTVNSGIDGIIARHATVPAVKREVQKYTSMVPIGFSREAPPNGTETKKTIADRLQNPAAHPLT